MWILIIYIGLGHTLDDRPAGGPATAEFQSRASCELALKQIKESFGEARDHDQRFQFGEGGTSRVWTIKGGCVAK